MSVVGLVPAAGHATRLNLSEGSKEAQPIRGRPVIEYLLDRMALGGADRVRVVIRSEKQDVARIAERWGAEVVVGEPATAAASISLAAESLAGDDIALFGFPDTIWTPADGYVQLRLLVEAGEEIALGIFRSPYPARSDVAVLDTDGRVVRIDVKPDVPATDRVWACGAVRVGTLRRLVDSSELGIAMSRQAALHPIATATLGRVIDVGTPQAFQSAATDPVFDDS